MNGGQDLGGMMGFGPIAPEPNEPVFHADWERRTLALSLAAGGCREWNIDTSRHARETLPPAQYLSKSYYDIWISGLEKLLLQAGMVSPADIAAGHTVDAPKQVKGKLMAADVASVLARGAPAERPASTPTRFSVGETVRTKVINPATHTRLPRYARGKLGRIESVLGHFVFPDFSAHGKDENPQWCYTVVFTGRELWGEDADPRVSVSINAWEPYLERA
jgi:nitrile hydratase